MTLVALMNFNVTQWIKRHWRAKRPHRVLVVEDHTLAQECIKNAASVEKVEVDVVKKAETALGLLHLNGGDYAAAVIDVMLPDMNGWTLCNVIAKKWPKIKIVIISIDAANFAKAPLGKPVTIFRKSGRHYESLFRYLKRELAIKVP